jgi:cell division protein ZapA (FtsZ GTPase activity inhibitor)
MSDFTSKPSSNSDKDYVTVKLKVASREYVLSCAKGQEVRLSQIGRYVDEKVSKTARSLKPGASDAQVLLITLLGIVDSMFDSMGEEQQANNDKRLAKLLQRIDRINQALEME